LRRTQRSPVGSALLRHFASKGSCLGSPHGETRAARPPTQESTSSSPGNKAQALRGRVKRNTGEVTGDRDLQAEGRIDEGKGHLKQAGEKIKDAFRGRGRRR
jgi:uncharacterized protein YjbJ (UPF0337 family)